jgi:tetratricopeptide (TPR) repeat protein
MQVDSRRDHSFRIPRPDLSVRLGTPNACATCHAERGPRWAAERVAEWRHDTSAIGFQRFASAFAAVEAGRPEARKELNEVAGDSSQPAIARATALAEIAAQDDRTTLDVLSRGLNDRSPLVRLGAVEGATRLSPGRRAAFVAPLLGDSMMVVRIEALPFGSGAGVQSSAQQAAFERVASEYIASQQFNADRADARTNLGTFYAQLGDLSRAETELRKAIRLDPFFLPAYVNLADVFRASTARDPEAEEVLRAGLALAPSDARLRHALGLALIRLHRLEEARAELQRAAALEPRNVRFGYVYAVALHSTGRNKESIAELRRVLAIDPEDRDALVALSVYQGPSGVR